MTDIQSAITRLRAADEQHPDFWNTLQDRDADPQMLRDVVAVARRHGIAAADQGSDSNREASENIVGVRE